MSVDPGAGSPLERTLDREYYLSEEIFAREKERILFREWFCVGREEELPEAGSYAVKDVAGESVLLVRTREGGLAGHYNVCRHRGSQLVPDSPRASCRCIRSAWNAGAGSSSST
jgi:phenylpropionate dioxygenase-like ring-hydroxylating dioxygenase large terminal subunit